MSEYSIPSFVLVKSATAEQTFSAKGKTIGKGKTTTRLQVEGVTDPRVQVAAKELKERSPLNIVGKMMDSIRYAKVTLTGGERIAINYGSLERIGISKAEAKQAAQRGDLPSLIAQHVQKTQVNLGRMDEYVGKVLPKYQTPVSDKANLVAQTGDAIKLSKVQLQKVTWLAVTSATQSAKVIRAGKARVLVQSVAGDTFHMTALHQSKVLGKGGFGVVSQVYDLTNGTFAAMKVALTEEALIGAAIGLEEGKVDPGKGEEAKRDVQNEAQMLFYLHEIPEGEPPPRGIQAAPVHLAFEVEGGGMTGYIGALYDKGDLRSARELFKTPEQKIDALHQLFSGLAHAQSKGVANGDIKPGNILVRTDPNRPGQYEVHLADWGGGKKLREATLRFGTGTTPYILNNDRTAIKAAVKTRQEEKNNDLSAPSDDKTPTEAQLRYEQLQHKRDVFALGVTAFEFLTGERPYSLHEDGSPTSADIAQTLNDPKVQSKLAEIPRALEFFQLVLNPKITERPLPNEALQRFEELLFAKESPTRARL